MLWKRPNLTQRISSVSVRQGLSLRPSRTDRQRDCSLEETRVIPCEWYVSSLCPQVSENWKIRRFLFILDPILFMPDPKYSYRILSFYSYRILFYSCRIWSTHTGSTPFIRTGSYFIYAGSEKLIPDPLFYSYQIRIFWVAANYSREFKYHRELTTCLRIICTGSENAWVKLSNWLISWK